MIPRFAVITTYNRPNLCLRTIECLADDTDDIFVIDNGDNIPMPVQDDVSTLSRYTVYPIDLQPVNLSHLWNIGIGLAEQSATRAGYEQWDVAIFNDDLYVPPGWFGTVAQAMRGTTAVAACSGPTRVLQQKAEPVPLHTRMTGWSFVLRGEARLRADERFWWWFGDDDLDWTARTSGGMLMVAGEQPLNLLPNGLMTPERHAQSNRDARAFQEKWQGRPW